jgi:aspartate/methionine/tyrosine aminotransferase
MRTYPFTPDEFADLVEHYGDEKQGECEHAGDPKFIEELRQRIMRHYRRAYDAMQISDPSDEEITAALDAYSRSPYPGGREAMFDALSAARKAVPV